MFAIYETCVIINKSNYSEPYSSHICTHSGIVSKNILQEVIAVVKKEMIAMLLAGGQGSRLGVLTSKVGQTGSCIWRQVPNH